MTKALELTPEEEAFLRDGQVNLEITAFDIFNIVALLQLAIRHPGVSARMSRGVRAFVDRAGAEFPASLKAKLQLGFDPANDVPAPPVLAKTDV